MSVRPLFALLFTIAVAGEVLAACSADPSASATYTVNASGTGTLAVTYSFPDTTSSSQRSLVVYIDGAAYPNYYAVTKPATASGTWTVAMSSTCWTTGSHQVRVTAQSCGTRTVNWLGSIEVNATPEVAAEYLGPDASGDGTLAVTYKFPNTASSSQRDLKVYVDGTSYPNYAANYKPTTMEGTWNVGLDTTCWTSGTHSFRVVAQACASTFE